MVLADASRRSAWVWRRAASSSSTSRVARGATRRCSGGDCSSPTTPCCNRPGSRSRLRALLARGVRIYESTPVARFTAGPPVRRDAPGGLVPPSAACSGSARGRRRCRGSAGDRAARHVHRRHRAGAGAARGDRLDRRRRPRRLAHRAPLLPHHPGRTDRVRRRRRHRRARRRARPATALRRALDRQVRRRFSPVLPFVGRRRIEAAWGGPMDVTGRHLPSFGTLPGGTVHSASATRAGGLDRAIWAARSSRRWRSGSRTSTPRCRSSTSRCCGSRRSRCSRSAPRSRSVRSSARTRRRTVGSGRSADAFVARMPRRMGYELGP